MAKTLQRVHHHPRATAPVLLVLAGVGATAAAVIVIAVSRIAPHPVTQSILTAAVCLVFVGTGAYAARLQPYARFGLLLGAVGFASLVSVLHEANGAALYTLGVLASNVVFAVIVHALLAFPSGRLRSRGRRLLVGAAYADVLVLQVLATLVDPLTRYHSAHPRNLILVDRHPDLATGLLELEAAIAAAIAVVALVVLSRGARAATPVARRHLVPVVASGKVVLLAFAVGLALAPLSSEAGLLGFGLGLLAALALPVSFLAIMLRARLSRAAVGELLVELREPRAPDALRDGLRRALGDPSLELLRVREEDGVYVDAAGARTSLPAAGDVLTATPILHQGEPLGALVHDRSLRFGPQLLDAVGAAAGFALANERGLGELQRIEARNRALLDALPDRVFRISRDGTYLDVHREVSAIGGPTAKELIGRNLRDVLPAGAAAATLVCVERALDRDEPTSLEYALELGGAERWFELRMVPSGPAEVVMIARDFTEQRHAEVARRGLAEEQAALRRVATLVASDAAPEHVFQAVTAAACDLLGIRTAVLHRFEDEATSTIVGKYGEPTGAFELGRVNRLEEGTAREVLRTGAPARVAYAGLTSPGAQELHALGYRGSVGVPIIVAGLTWGALVVALRGDDTLPPATERRLEGFAELVALAVSSAHARNELAASRLRLVEASDAARRRIERNLHDGAQQRLVGLALGLRLAQAKLPAQPDEAAALLVAARAELDEALVELRELAQGIHPAVLTARGLEAALDTLAARAPLPVALEAQLETRLAEPVEAAAYYVVSEALANVVKHARATSVVVRAEQRGDELAIEVVDDGVGGVDLAAGSGLRGLRDRVETLGGELHVTSEAGRGTTVRAALPVAAGHAVAAAPTHP
jgi:PAS domain S-box-containing protein